MILALESVFDQCSVAFVDLTGNVVAEQTLTGNRLQTQQILPKKLLGMIPLKTNLSII